MALSPAEALISTLGDIHFYESKRRWPKPGGLVERMPVPIREALSRLTAEDLATLRYVEAMECFRKDNLRKKGQLDQLLAAQRRETARSKEIKLQFDRQLARRF